MVALKNKKNTVNILEKIPNSLKYSALYIIVSVFVLYNIEIGIKTGNHFVL